MTRNPKLTLGAASLLLLSLILAGCTSFPTSYAEMEAGVQKGLPECFDIDDGNMPVRPPEGIPSTTWNYRSSAGPWFGNFALICTAFGNVEAFFITKAGNGSPDPGVNAWFCAITQDVEAIRNAGTSDVMVMVHRDQCDDGPMHNGAYCCRISIVQ